MPPLTRGMTTSVFLPVATSNTDTSPASLPPFDSDTATSLPSGDGTNQSIEVVPFVSSSFGSSRTRASAGLSARWHDDQERLLLGRLPAHGEHTGLADREAAVARWSWPP